MNNAIRDTPPKELDAVIVLGAGLRGENPTLVLSRRLDRTIKYLNENPNTIAILSGGQGEGETISEAEAMARYLKRHSVDEARYIKEDQSINTRENFSYSLQIIQERLGEDAAIGFVTTDFHVYRAGKVAQKQGVEAIGIPASDVWYIAINNRMRESIAIWAYALRGDI